MSLLSLRAFFLIKFRLDKPLNGAYAVQLSVDGLPNGIYLPRLKGNDGETLRKFVIQR